MIVLITGGSGSGKSEYAENLAVKLGKKERLYIATMMPADRESIQRIARHQDQRRNKGFSTLECYTGLKQLDIRGFPTVLLECMSNLLANEMFCEEGISKTRGNASVKEEILEGIVHLNSRCEHVVIVSNEVFSDNGSPYAQTAEYIKLLGEINCRIAALSSYVCEVVYGIPVCLKGERMP